jgi:alkanesulfonate monooxygenase SsuD/methylene tetrahydromethanopterin reductase-like flavin-dependent oxidoreductase (luciferase family)
MAMLEAARATEKIVIGPGVTNPGARPAVATAQALGTLAKVAPGRVVFGIGVGNSARFSLALPTVTLAAMRDYSVAVADLLARGESSEGFEGSGAPIRFIHPTGRWLDLEHQVETWVSAFGPRGRRMAGTYADAVFVRWEGAEALAVARAEVDAGAESAGRAPGEVKMAVVYAVYPIDSQEELDGEEARAALGPLAVSRLRYLTANHADPREVPERFRAGYLAYRAYREGLDARSRHTDNYEGYLVFTPPSLERFVDARSMRAIGTVGTPAEVVAELRAMKRAGVDHVSLQIAGPPAHWCERMGTEILPAVAS